MGSSFSQACASSRVRTDLSSILDGMGGALVMRIISFSNLNHPLSPSHNTSAFCPALCLPLMRLGQLFFFCLNAILNGVAFVRVKRMSKEQQTLVWKQQGLFTALAFCSSLFGAVAFGSRLRHLSLIYSVNKMRDVSNPSSEFLQYTYQQYYFRLRWCAAFYVMYPLELWFSLLAKMTVLNRMQLFSSRNAEYNRRWSVFNRVATVIIILCCAAGFIGNCVAATYYIRASDLMWDAAAASAYNTSLAFEINRQALHQDAVGDSIASAQRFTEMVVSLVITISFIAVGILSRRVISSALAHLFRLSRSDVVMSANQRSSDIRDLVVEATAKGKVLRFKVTCTIVFVFMTVLLRATVSSFYAAAMGFQDNSNRCSSSYCDPCRNVFSNIQGWILYTPE